MYRTDLFEAAGLTMPENPDWDLHRRRGAQDHRPRQRHQRHLPARQGRLGREHGVPHRAQQLVRRQAGSTRTGRRSSTSRRGRNALQFYADLMKDAGPGRRLVERLQREPDAVPAGQVRHVDRRHRRRLVRDRPRTTRPSPTRSASRSSRTRRASSNHGNWLWSWNLAIPASLEERRRGQDLHRVGDLQGLHRPRRREGGLGRRASGHPHLALRECRLQGGRALRRADAGGDERGRHHQADRSSRCPTPAASSSPSPSSSRSAPPSASCSRRWSPASRRSTTRSPRRSRSPSARCVAPATQVALLPAHWPPGSRPGGLLPDRRDRSRPTAGGHRHGHPPDREPSRA